MQCAALNNVIRCSALVKIVTYFWLRKPFGLDIADLAHVIVLIELNIC